MCENLAIDRQQLPNYKLHLLTLCFPHSSRSPSCLASKRQNTYKHHLLTCSPLHLVPASKPTCRLQRATATVLEITRAQRVARGAPAHTRPRHLSQLSHQTKPASTPYSTLQSLLAPALAVPTPPTRDTRTSSPWPSFSMLRVPFSKASSAEIPLPPELPCPKKAAGPE